MNKSLLMWVSGAGLLALSQAAVAGKTVYQIRADGLACPYCAYGIEKKLNAIEGVQFRDIDLETGIVTVETDGVTLENTQLQQLFQDAGFTFRSKQIVEP